jgi:hypothetical protein
VGVATVRGGAVAFSTGTNVIGVSAPTATASTASSVAANEITIVSPTVSRTTTTSKSATSGVVIPFVPTQAVKTQKTLTQTVQNILTTAASAALVAVIQTSAAAQPLQLTAPSVTLTSERSVAASSSVVKVDNSAAPVVRSAKALAVTQVSIDVDTGTATARVIYRAPAASNVIEASVPAAVVRGSDVSLNASTSVVTPTSPAAGVEYSKQERFPAPITIDVVAPSPVFVLKAYDTRDAGARNTWVVEGNQNTWYV